MLLFIVNYLFFFWSTWLVTFSRIIKHTSYEWGIFCMKYFRSKINVIGDNRLYEDGECLYFTNHRSQSDFFIDQVLIKGKGIFIARWLVGYFFFMFIPVSLYGRALMFFKRKKGIRNFIFNLVEKYKKDSPLKSLLIYPEGTRHQGNESKKLKTGFIKHSFDKDIPIQIIITKGKEDILCSQTLKSNFNITLETEYSKPIYPRNFNNYEEFEKKILGEWNIIWKSVYSNNEKKLTPLIYQNFESNNIMTRSNIIKYYISQILVLVSYLYLSFKIPLFLLLPYVVVLFNFIIKK